MDILTMVLNCISANLVTRPSLFILSTNLSSFPLPCALLSVLMNILSFSKIESITSLVDWKTLKIVA